MCCLYDTVILKYEMIHYELVCSYWQLVIIRVTPDLAVNGILWWWWFDDCDTDDHDDHLRHPDALAQ